VTVKSEVDQDVLFIHVCAVHTNEKSKGRGLRKGYKVGIPSPKLLRKLAFVKKVENKERKRRRDLKES
jgi:hypothetical protein